MVNPSRGQPEEDIKGDRIAETEDLLATSLLSEQEGRNNVSSVWCLDFNLRYVERGGNMCGYRDHIYVAGRKKVQNREENN